MVKRESYRYPFVAAEILSNSAKLADAFIEEIKHEVSLSPSKEDSSAVPALIEQEESAEKVEEEIPSQPEAVVIEEAADAKTVEDLLKEV